MAGLSLAKIGHFADLAALECSQNKSIILYIIRCPRDTRSPACFEFCKIIYGKSIDNSPNFFSIFADYFEKVKITFLKLI